jgi:hypothetical protein
MSENVLRLSPELAVASHRIVSHFLFYRAIVYQKQDGFRPPLKGHHFDALK